MLYFQTFIALFLKLWTNSEARNSSDYFWAFYVVFKFQIRANPHTVKEVFKPGGCTQVHVPQNVTLHPLHYIFSFLNLVKLSALASSSLFLPHVSAWISLITSRSFVFNRLKTHFNTADISRALRAFLPILTHFKLFSWRHFTLTSRTAALGGTEGSGQRSGQSFRAIYLMDFALDVWNTSLNSASGHSIGVCMHARVCVYMSCMCFKVTVLKGKWAGSDPLNVWKLGIFTLYRENT